MAPRWARQLVGIEYPILPGPWSAPGTAELAIAVSEAGGLGERRPSWRGLSFLSPGEAASTHARALGEARDDRTVVTNVLTGRPARGFYNRAIQDLGPMVADAPEFPSAATALAPLRVHAEAQGSGDFSPLWAGQAAALGRTMRAQELTRSLALEALAVVKALNG